MNWHNSGLSLLLLARLTQICARNSLLAPPALLRGVALPRLRFNPWMMVLPVHR
jgi:hypothetical protein